MTTVSEDASIDLKQRIAELERRLETALVERDAAIDRQTASALVSFRLQNELRAALDRQKAGAEILRSIAATAGDAEHALQTIAETTQQFFNAASVSIRVAEGDEWVRTVRVGAGAQLPGAQPAAQLATRGANLPATVYQENRQIHIPDLDNPDPSMTDWPMMAARAGGIRTICGTPLRREGKAIGALVVYRDRLAAFTDEELALQQSFADQAVIAIENARLFNESQDALARQTATTDILRVISTSPTDVQPVFDAIVQAAVRLLGCETAFIQRCDGTHFWSVARCRREEGLVPVVASQRLPIDRDANFPSRAIVDKGTLHLPDWSQIEVPEFERRIQEQLGYQSAVYLPLLREGECIGVLGIAGSRPRIFSQTEIALAESFCDQAVIAIENTRLFNETQEALERQTATADILKVIASSPTDVQPVFEAIATSARRLAGAFSAIVTQVVDEMIHVAASTAGNEDGRIALRSAFPVPVSSPAIHSRVVRTGQLAFSTDIESDTSLPPARKELARARGYRSVLVVPLLREGLPIGTVGVAREEPGEFDEQIIGLLRTFADQAVIAIENARLFNETREALERQTATADILKVIASSPSNVQPVFDAIAASANRLMHAHSTTVWRSNEGMVHLAAFTPIDPIADEALRSRSSFPSSSSVYWHLIRDGNPAQFVDTENVSPSTGDVMRDLGRARGFRSLLVVPLMSDGVAIGTINVTRATTGSFAEADVQLLRTFADQAVIAIENARLFNETQEALERQTATADILKVIASSPSDVKPVFEAIAESAKRLIGGFSTTVHPVIDDIVHLAAFTPTNPESDAILQATFPVHRSEVPAVALVENGETAQIADSEAGDVQTQQLGRARGWRSVTFTPLMNRGTFIGFITCTRRETGLLAEHHVQLLRTFADQAVIAIENTRLFNETREALERQTATADILKVIASSPSDVAPVFEAIVTSAARLFEPCAATITTVKDGKLHWNATAALLPGYDIEGAKTIYPIPFDPDRSPSARAILERRIIEIPDTDAPDTPEFTRKAAAAGGFRAITVVPLIDQDLGIGTIIFAHPHPGFKFSDKQLALVQTFADQAVIAIGNARLFDEVQAKTRDLTEALTYQTGSANILSVIASSPTDVGPVLKAIVESACELCDAYDAVVLLRDGDDLRASAHHGPIPVSFSTWPINRQWTAGRTFVDRKAVHVHDLQAEQEEFPDGQALAARMGHRSIISVPLLSEGDSIGVIVLRRTEVHPFTDKQIGLLQTFADQAVIAIGNVRLFDEVQARTRELTEALTYQTGSANILRVIASSPTVVGPVLKAIVESACELCGAYDAVVRLRNGDSLDYSAHHGPIPVTQLGIPINRRSAAGLAMIEQRPVHVRDLLTSEGDAFPDAQDRARRFGHRTILSVPLLREGEAIGTIVLRRTEVNPFSDKQIALLQTFADQAVIAIGNVRLFEEVQQRTRDLTESLQQQTATSEVLKVISSSPGELGPVFRSMLENAVNICDAQFGNLLLVDGDRAHWEAGVGTPPKLAEFFTQSAWFQPTPGSHLHRIMRTKQVSHTADDLAEPVVGAAARLGGARSTVCVPMVKDDVLVGTIFIYRTEVRPFTDKQIDLVRNFAAQAVIAIENTRLLKELRQRTDDLTKSLDDLRTAQDRLIQTEKLASLGQLTAGIAHEIKNPLNFVNNFAALSAELTDELKTSLKPAVLDKTIRAEVNELTGLLKDNLDKVVQHGKRADSIVKNMLLHSREGSGEHRPSDINALVDESLNLAYHGARAEKPQFNVTLKRDFDPEAGMIEAFPQEITRVFLNLISNGFYAVSKRKAEHGDAAFEPQVTASTRGGADHVEIRIRDNGTGIPPDVKEKMFNPFFTTKPAGEGTGLGLSMSHDIVVKQHGGTIEVDTEPGQFTEFTIVLPRTNDHSNKTRG